VDLGHRQHAKADGAGSGDNHGLGIGMDLLCAVNAVAVGAHDVEQHGGFGQRGPRVDGEEDAFGDQFVDAVAAVAVEAHVAALVQALIGEAVAAMAALAAVVHEEHYAGRTHGRGRARPGGNYYAGGLMAGRHARALVELSSLGPAEGVGLDLEQELAWASGRHWFFCDTDAAVPQEVRDCHCGWYCWTGHLCVSSISSMSNITGSGYANRTPDHTGSPLGAPGV